ncbi:helix-turn-helix domain-containing protein [Evansella clarkii]|uniref:helix-turn-helix domain-containing protein n=1 Tax=Evansella clarkii TaxID=79879 RepID=UPI000998B019|nr:helix-turn-helix domain-containing protein [Evansella clarkii]
MSTPLGLYDLTQKVKGSADMNVENDAIMEIIDMFDPKIKSKIRTLDEHAGEDLKQELTFEITKALQRFDLTRAPSFIEYVEHKNCRITGRNIIEKANR